MLFLATGCICLVLGSVGIVLPILPTVPFFLVTASSQLTHFAMGRMPAATRFSYGQRSKCADLSDLLRFMKPS